MTTPMRVAPATMEMVNAQPSFSSPSDPAPYVAPTERGPEPALREFNLRLLDEPKGNGKVQGAAQALQLLYVPQPAAG